MQLYALDNQQLTLANHAVKQKDYVCVECGSLVRLRGGLHRQRHFYHVAPSRTCTLHGKSMEHLQVQCFLQKLLPVGDCQLECRLAAIERIADVFWVSAKIVFEVQCSPITAEEVRLRNQAYATLGLTVIWILHDARFNQWKAAAAELFLEGHPHFFTNLNAEGVGHIYDQYAPIKGGLRKKLVSALTVDLSALHDVGAFLEEGLRATPPIAFPLPPAILERLQTSPLSFKGDLVYRYFKERDKAEMQAAWNLLHSHSLNPAAIKLGWPKRLAKIWQILIVKPYTHFFQMLLERACK